MMKRILLACALVVSLVSCSSPEPKPERLNLNFTTARPIVFDVQNINVFNRSAPTSRASTINMTPSVEEAVRQWTRDKVQTTGRSGQASIIIKEASVTSQPLALQTGIDSWFTRQQSHRYTAKLEVDIEARSTDGLKNGFATAHATRTITLPEDPTPVERAKAYNDLIKGLMDDFDIDMVNAVRQHMSQFLLM